ncbi:MAG TPA: hypothetical protein DEB24_03945, partial [Coriobacteriia bacterium]|nr:hypothetical protein [Coriobacteriia bacterium]
KNARDIVEIGAADMIADSELDDPVFMEKLLRLLTDGTYRERMLQAILSSGRSRARQELAQRIIALVEGRSPK